MSGNHEVRAVMKAYGDVQRVGYRFVVQDLARKIGVKGYVKNLPDGSVKIVAEASREIVDKFIGALKFRETPIDVERLDVDYKEATGEYEHFRLTTGNLAEEIVEGFGTGLKYINLSRDKTRQGFKRVEESITASIKDMRTDLKGSITAMHGDMNKHFEEMAKRYDAISSELIRTREELTRAVDNMSKLIDTFIERHGKRNQ